MEPMDTVQCYPIRRVCEGHFGAAEKEELGKTEREGEDPAIVKGPHKGISNFSHIQ